MKRIKVIILVVFGVLLAVGARGQEASIVVHPDGLRFPNGETFMVVETGDSREDIISNIVANVKIKENSPRISVEVVDDAVVIKNFVPGYTKTDKSVGSAYLLDLFYKLVVDVKDGRYRVNIPVVVIASNQKYDGFAVIANPAVQFTVTMDFAGKRDVWNNREKKLFIYDEKGKLVEKSTKEKLEQDLSKIVNLLIDQAADSNW